jgi:hypothetical protein
VLQHPWWCSTCMTAFLQGSTEVACTKQRTGHMTHASVTASLRWRFLLAAMACQGTRGVADASHCRAGLGFSACMDPAQLCALLLHPAVQMSAVVKGSEHHISEVQQRNGCMQCFCSVSATLV